MSTKTDFPLIYCNGDSYSNHRYDESLLNKTYANFVANVCQGFVINNAVDGSCNRRIIRTTLHDIILQRRLNPTQKIIALVGLTFEVRSEIWVDDLEVTKPEESNFRTHLFSSQINWRENLLEGKSLNTLDHNRFNLERKFFKQFSSGRAYFFSPYAERINLLADLIMLRSVMESLDVEFLIFQAPRAEELEDDYLLNFFKTQLSNDPRIFDLEKFGFVDWCHQKNFVPLDFLERPEIGHYGSDAHQAFAEQILVPKLKELSIL
jgi:hypothetical protein